MIVHEDISLLSVAGFGAMNSSRYERADLSRRVENTSKA